MHVLDPSHRGDMSEPATRTAFRAMRSQLSCSSIAHISLLGFLYSFNNQLSFYVYMFVDPGTVFLFKAAGVFIVATVQCTFYGKTFTAGQWRAMMLQVIGMIVV